MTKLSDGIYIHARVSRQLAAAAKLAAEDDKTYLSSIIRQALEEFLQKKGYPTRAS